MARRHSPYIVTDNLLSYWDAANSKSYPDSGTEWKDLVRNNNGNRQGMDSTNKVDNYVNLTGVSDEYVIVDGLLDTQNEWTVTSWFQTADNTVRQEIISEWKSGHATGWRSIIGHHNTGYFHSLVGASQTAISTALTENVWYFGIATYTHIGTSLTLRTYDLDGNTEEVTTSRTSEVRTMNTLFYHAGITSPWNGKIGTVAVYTKVLSDEELLQNYNAIKPRYQ